MDSGNQSRTPFGASRIEHLATTAGGHPGTEAVSAGPLEPAGLKCAFHDLDTLCVVIRNHSAAGSSLPGGVRYRQTSYGAGKKGAKYTWELVKTSMVSGLFASATGRGVDFQSRMKNHRTFLISKHLLSLIVILKQTVRAVLPVDKFTVAD
jgi:hypothetical protein